MTIGRPNKILTYDDIPAAVKGAARYRPTSARCGGFDVIMTDTGGRPWEVDYKGSLQAALRAAIRLQKKENAAVTKASKGKL